MAILIIVLAIAAIIGCYFLAVALLKAIKSMRDNANKPKKIE